MGVVKNFLELASKHRQTIRDGVWELRMNVGPGYRVYYAMQSKVIIILLCGGDKRSQQRDIERAVIFWRECQDRSKP
jgi:putative addiction module killer protein